MKSAYSAFLCAGAVFVAATLFFGLGWLLAIRKGWASLRFLTLLLLLSYVAIGLVIWPATHESWAIWAVALMGPVNTAVLLSLHRTNPKLMKSLKLRW